MIKNEAELKATLKRIEHFRRIVENIRRTERNPENYRASVGGFLAEIDRMNLEVREYYLIHPSEMEKEIIAA